MKRTLLFASFIILVCACGALAQADKETKVVPVTGVAQMPDGSLLVSNDTDNIIYRITYNSKTRNRQL